VQLACDLVGCVDVSNRHPRVGGSHATTLTTLVDFDGTHGAYPLAGHGLQSVGSAVSGRPRAVCAGQMAPYRALRCSGRALYVSLRGPLGFRVRWGRKVPSPASCLSPCAPLTLPCGLRYCPKPSRTVKVPRSCPPSRDGLVQCRFEQIVRRPRHRHTPLGGGFFAEAQASCRITPARLLSVVGLALH
jgi:hypothetical protein